MTADIFIFFLHYASYHHWVSFSICDIFKIIDQFFFLSPILMYVGEKTKFCYFMLFLQ